jgi:hypothetical protein
MGHQPLSIVSRLHSVHHDLQAAAGRDINRDDFHRIIIAGTGVGYPQIYSHIKTGVVLGLWSQSGGRNGPFRIHPTTPPPSQAPTEAPMLAG